ncbi:glycoside hydrolase family 2 TIM barrel-domain containing protein [Actinocrispum sp. NPDC049592]|uniref:glycoside hydrolase family 2 TIM barrel-domain containing protein n=1 Tax=Actinocrispum sp. NPDC049592 TaxID=3154835 RepID=UPI00344AB89F
MRGSVRFLTVFVLFAAGVVVAPATAAPPGPDAYAYLDNPRMTGEGQEAPHASLRPYGDTASAARHEENTPFTASLDGAWKIAMAPRPQEVPAGFFAEDYDVRAWQTTTVPHTLQTAGLDHPMFRNIPEEIWPDNPPFAPKDVNPTAAYVRDFTLPARWQGRQNYLRFEGVTAGYFVWVNGKYLGYDQGGYTPAEFDITSALHPGSNRIAVQVHRWGSGSYLEDYDQWRYSGIFRSVWMYSTPTTHIRDLTVTTDLDANYTDATLTARVSLARQRAGALAVRASLRDSKGAEVAAFTGTTTGNDVTLSTVVHNPLKWTDETPNLYTLVLSLGSHITSETVGFREFTIADRQLKVNGKRVLFKGVNRSETDPDNGRHVPRSRQEQDVQLMKQFNVNAVRTSHYPSDPYFYDLADRNGIWIDDEVDIETHAHESCPSVCLAEKPEWQDAFHDRFVAMVQRDKNHPSVFMWDTGNEAGLGKAHFAMADWAKANEPTRPLYHQSNSPDGDAPYANVWGPRYPSPERLAQQAVSTTKPVILGEYAHAMGNSLGNFREFWDTIRANPQLQGGFIWDWAEQNLRQDIRITPTGSDILAHLSGQPSVVDGHRGKALSFSGLDDFVEVYRDRRLEITSQLTLDAWVKPDTWTGDFTVIAKGDHAYALKMKTQNTLEFFIYSGTWRVVQVPVPADFYGNWHRITGTYDGATLRLYIDGKQAGSTAFAGAIDNSFYEVNIGRNPEVMQDQYGGRMAHGAIDDVRIYNRALPAEVLAAGGDPAADAVLAMDFDKIETRGTYLSNGESLSGVDGLIGSDRFAQPETAQLTWAHQPLRFSYADGSLTVRSERQFASTAATTLQWKVVEGSRTVASGSQPLTVEPNSQVVVPIPVPANPAGMERWLTVNTVGTVPALDQFSLGGTVIPGAGTPPATGSVSVVDGPNQVSVSGGDFQYTLDKASGGLTSMQVRGTQLVKSGPQLDAWRAPISNETYDWGNAEGVSWRAVGLDRLRTKANSVSTVRNPDGTVTITVASTVTGRADATFEQTLKYTVDAAGTIRLAHTVSPRGAVRTLPYLPKIGVSLAVPDRFQQFTWYGRGPHESYNDRKDGTPVGVYRSTVDEQYVSYYRPQDHGNHTDTRWALLTDGQTGGLLVSGANDVSVTPYDDLDRAAYPFELQRNPGWVTLHADYAVTGVGDTPNPVRARYQVRPDQDVSATIVIRPLSAAEVTARQPA